MPEEFNHFDKIADTLEPTLSKVVRKTAFDIQAKAAENAPVDTGFLKNSIYVVGAGYNTYGRGVKKAGELKANKKGVISNRRRKAHAKRLQRQKEQEAMLLPQIPQPSEAMTAFAAVGANYGEIVELGSVRQPAHPYFYPAVDAVKPSFDAAINAVQAKLEEAVG